MASMNSRTLPPLPQTERGFPCNVLCANNGSLAYASGSGVVVFHLDEPPVIVNHHNVKVSAVSFSPSGSWVASGDVKGNLKIWGSRGDRILKYEYRLISSAIRGICWSPDGKRVAVCGGEPGRGGEGCCVSYDTGSALGAFSGHSKPISCVAYRPVAPYRIITGSEDTSVVFHEGPPFKFMRSCKISHSGFVNAVAFTPDGSKALSCGNDGIVAVYSGDSGDFLSQLDPKLSCSIWGMALDAKGDPYLACGDKKLRYIVDNAVVSEVTVREGHVKDMPLGIASDPKAGVVHAITLDGTLLHFHMNREIELKSVTAGSQSAISSIGCVGNTVYVMSVDETVWSLAMPWMASNPALVSVKKPFKASAGFLVGANGLVVVSAANDSDLISIPSGEVISGHNLTAISRLISSRKSGAIIGDKSKVYSIYNGQSFINTETVDEAITSLSLSDDGSTVAYACERPGGGSLASQNAKREVFINGSILVTEMKISDVVQVAVSGDGSLLAVASAAHELHVYRRPKDNSMHWELEPDTLKAWTYHKGKVQAMVWVESRFLVTGALDKAIYVWDVTRAIAGPVATLKDTHKEGVSSLFAEMHGNILAIVSGGIEGSVKVTEIDVARLI